ncbi:MAG TPA: RNase H family protein [Blastocatellia bacterium]|nr:RNase H family protein [Blastocatellia bacterium]
MKKVTIVCDGSSLGNGKEVTRAGAVAVLIYIDREGSRQQKVVGEYLGQATNNQAEIVAAAIGLEALKVSCDVELITDSQYVVQTLNGNYREKTNHEFWQRLRAAAQQHRVKWTWTRGHNKHPIQEECDRAARKIASAGSPDASILAEATRRVSAATWSPSKG